MSPDASEITAPKDPAEYRPRPLMGATYWAMMALMVLCVLAGVAIALFVPKLVAPEGAGPGARHGERRAPCPPPCPRPQPSRRFRRQRPPRRRPRPLRLRSTG